MIEYSNFKKSLKRLESQFENYRTLDESLLNSFRKRLLGLLFNVSGLAGTVCGKC